jgi:hypothetical protein
MGRNWLFRITSEFQGGFMERRSFMVNSAVAATALAAGLGPRQPAAWAQKDPNASPGRPSADKVGRPVNIASIGFRPRLRTLDQIIDLVDGEGRRGVDLIVLPDLYCLPD